MVFFFDLAPFSMLGEVPPHLHCPFLEKLIAGDVCPTLCTDPIGLCTTPCLITTLFINEHIDMEQML